MRNRNNLIAFAFAAVLLCFSGCKEKVPATGVVEITGPAGMTVSVAGKKFIKNPLQLKVRPGTYGFCFDAPGHYARWKCITVKAGTLQKVSVELEKVLSAVLIDSVPQGAEVHFNGKTLGATPLVISDLYAGKYTAELVKPGYARQQVKWEINSGRPHPGISVPLDRISGTVVIETVPSGARVFFNGKDAGLTPCRRNLDSGVYRMRIECSGCEPFDGEITILQGKSVHRTIRLAARPGELKVVSVPGGASVFVDGAKVGNTPYFSNNIAPGSHLVRLEHSGFDVIEKNIEIAPGGVENLRCELQKSTGSAQFIVLPVGVRCLVDGKDAGVVRKDKSGSVLPLVINELSPGKHVLTVTHPLAKPVKKDLVFVIEKNRQFNMRTPVELWVANCEVEFRNGKKEKGAIFGETETEIYYSPQPGVKYYVAKTNLRKINRIPIEEVHESQKPEKH